MNDNLIERLNKLDTYCFEEPWTAAEIGREAAAALAAKDTALSAFMIRNGFATGHGDTFADLLAELEWQVKGREAALATSQAEPPHREGE